MTDFVSRVQELVAGLSSSSSQESDLFLLQVGPKLAHRARLCAIPHTFDAAVIQVLDSTAGPSDAEQAIAQMRQLPAVMQLSDCLALHDVVRKQLFAQWLMPERRIEFSAVSRRLADYYRSEADDNTIATVLKSNVYLFHLLGADLVEGFTEFQRRYAESASRRVSAIVRLWSDCCMNMNLCSVSRESGGWAITTRKQQSNAATGRMRSRGWNNC